MLNIPNGSVVLLDYSRIGWPDWADKYVSPAEVSGKSDKEKLEVLLAKSKLYKKLNIYIKDNKSIDGITAADRPFDPERAQTQEEIKRALTRSTNEKLLEKLMISKGIPPSKLKDALSRWEKAGFVKRESGKVSLPDPDFDEDSVSVMEYIKTNDNATENYIAAHTGIKGAELKQVLEKLIHKDKIQLLPNGSYDLKLTPEEMNTITEPEEKVMKVIKDGSPTDYDDFYITGMTSQDVRAAVKNLIRKGKVFKSKFFGQAFRLTKSADEPMTSPETKLLDYLKKWPNTDMFTLRRRSKNIDLLYKSFDGLMARGLVTIDENEHVSLNKDKVADFKPDAKGYSETAYYIIKLCGTHFITNYAEIVRKKQTEIDKPKEGKKKGVGFDTYSLNSYLTVLVDKGLLTRDGYRYMPADPSFVKPQTFEERMLLHIAEKKEGFTEDQATRMVHKKEPWWASMPYLIRALKSADKLKEVYHPIEQKTYYHLPTKQFKIDTSEYENGILEILEKSEKPLDADDIRTKFNEKGKKRLSEEAIGHILNKMLAEVMPKIKQEEDFTGTDYYYLSHKSGPKKKEEYYDEVKKILAEAGPLDGTALHEKLSKATGINYYAVDYVIRGMTEIDPPMIENSYSNVSGEYLYHLPGQKVPEMNDYKNQILGYLHEKPYTSRDLRKKLIEDKVNVSSDSLTDYLNELAGNDEIKRTKGYNNQYLFHMPDQDPLAAQTKEFEERVLEILKKQKDETTKARTFYDDLYYNKGVDHSNIRKILKDMVEKHMLYIKEGDLDDAEDMWDTVLTTGTVDPASVVKSPKLVKAKQHILEYVKANEEKKGGAVQASDVANHVQYKISSINYDKIKQAIQELIQSHELYIKEGDLDDKNEQWETKLTTQYVDPATVIKNPKVAKAKIHILEFVKDNDGKTARDAANFVYSKGISSEKALQAILELVQNQQLYVKEGDLNDASTKWDAVLTTNYVDPSTVVKNPKLEKAKKLAVDFVASKSGQPVMMKDIGGHIKMSLNISMWSQAQSIMKAILQQGLLHVATPLDEYDFWDQEVTLPGATPPAAQPTPAAPQPVAAENPEDDVLAGLKL